MTAELDDRQPNLGPRDVVVSAELVWQLVPRRPFAAYKWGVGGLLIVAGAPHYAGAPILCAMAASRAGAGVVSLAVPRGLIGAIASAAPEATYVTLPETDSTAAAARAAAAIGVRLEKASAVLVGPGLGDDQPSANLLEALFGGASTRTRSIGFGSNTPVVAPHEALAPLATGRVPVVIDADALNWLSGQTNWWDRLPRGRSVLTPHLGEMVRLTGQSAEEIVKDPIGAAKSAARTWSQVVVLKYGYTIATDGERAVVADDAPRSLATAGTGDVFAGTIGAYLAQGLSAIDAATLAMYVGTRAARRIERSVGMHGLIASDLPRAIAEEMAILGSGDA